MRYSSVTSRSSPRGAGGDALEEILGAAAHGVQELAEEGVRSLREEVRHRLIVEVEGGAADLRLPAELLHGDEGEVLALQQAQQGLVHPLGGAEILDGI